MKKRDNFGKWCKWVVMKLYYHISRTTCIFKEYETYFIMQLFLDLGYDAFMILCLLLYACYFDCLLSRININEVVILMSHTRNRLRITFNTHTCIYLINIKNIIEKSSERRTILTKKYKDLFLIRIMLWLIIILLHRLWIYMQRVYIWLNLWNKQFSEFGIRV